MHTTAYFLSQAAHYAPSPDNTQPWKLNWNGDALAVGYDTQRVADSTFAANSHATLLTMGALSENLTQAASALGAKLVWTFPEKLNDSAPIYFRVSIASSNVSPITTIDNIPLFKRHTNRHCYQNQPLPGDYILLLKNLTVGAARVLVFDNKSDIQQVADLVRAASEIRFQTQEVHEWLGKSLRFNTKSTDEFGEGLDVATIDLPPGGRMFLRFISDWRRMCWLNKLGVYKAMALIDSQLISKAPALVAIVGPDQYSDTLAAGQLMNRVWIHLNSQGVAVHPYYVAADQLQRKRANRTPPHLAKQAEDISKHAQEFFNLGDSESVHMLFRVGYPMKTPIRSKRLSLKTVCSGVELGDS